MPGKIKQLSAKFHEISRQYHDQRSSALASAEEAIKAEMEVVKKSLGLTGLRAFFHNDHDGTGVTLEVCDSRYDDDWESWDDSVVKDKEGLLKDLADKLSELADYLEWNGVDIIV